MLNPNFLTGCPEAGEWLRLYHEALKQYGVEAVLYIPSKTMLPPKAVVHFFSSFDAETWQVLHETGCKVMITPALSTPALKRSATAGFWIKALRLVRAGSQFSFSPKDESAMRKTGRHYLVTSEACRSVLVREWGISYNSIDVFGDRPLEAAKIASQIYLRLS